MQPMLPRKTVFSLALVAVAALALSGCGKKDPGRKVTSFEPKEGPAQGGDAVVIKGQGFVTEGVPGVKIWFGDKEGRNVRFRGDDTVVVDVPPGEAGTEVGITMVFDDSGTIELPAKFKYVETADALNVDALTAGAKDEPAAAPEPAETEEGGE